MGGEECIYAMSTETMPVFWSHYAWIRRRGIASLGEKVFDRREAESY